MKTLYKTSNTMSVEWQFFSILFILRSRVHAGVYGKFIPDAVMQCLGDGDHLVFDVYQNHMLLTLRNLNALSEV